MYIHILVWGFGVVLVFIFYFLGAKPEEKRT